MGKQYAVAMVFRKPLSATEIQETLVCHIIYAVSAGNAFLEAYDKEIGGGPNRDKSLTSKVIVEIPTSTTTLSGEEGGEG